MTEKQRETAKITCGNNFRKHGMSNTRIYRIWRKMIERCTKVCCKEYVKYGGRGIEVCPEWKNSFQAFYDWSMANGYAENLTIDRMDVNGNYEPSNCRWATQLEQQNNRRNNKKYLYNGEMLTIPQIARTIGVKPHTLYDRINKYGYTLEQAISKKIRIWRKEA